PRPPRARARHDPARDHRPHDAGEPARGALARVHPDGGGEGTLADGRGPAPRALERAPPGADGGRAPGRPSPRGRDPHRDDLFVAGHRAVGLRIDRGPRLRDRAGGEPLHRGDRRGREPGDGPALRARGSAYQVRLMATVAGAVRGAVASGDRGRTPTGEAWRRLVASPVARAGLVVVAAFVLIAMITPAVHDYDAKTDANLMARLTPPTAAHPFATDTLGRAIPVRPPHATPAPPGLRNSLFAISLVSIPVYARLSRSAVLALREQDFVIAALSLGGSGRRVVLSHIVPNSLPPLIVQTTLSIAFAILEAAALGFLG